MYYRSPCLFFRNIVRSMSSCFGARQDHYGARGLWADHPCARGLARPLRALGLLARPLRARGLPRSLSDHGSGTSSLAPRPMLGDCLDHSLTTALGLRRSLLNLCSGTASTTLRPQLEGLRISTTCDWRLAYSWDIFSHLDLAIRLIPRLPASSGTTSVRCTCRCISYRLYDD